MVLPKILSPSFWVDKCLTLVLQLVLALLLQILYILKGEDVRVTDVKVTVRKTTPTDMKAITQAPARATKPARQNITIKSTTTGTNNISGELTRDLKSSVVSKPTRKAEEKIITGTLTELKPDKIDQNPELKITTETVSVVDSKKSDETVPVTIEVKKEEPVIESNISEISDSEKTTSITLKTTQDPVQNKKDESIPSQLVSEPEIKPIETVKGLDRRERVAQLAPLEMKTSHEYIHKNSSSTFTPIQFDWKHGGHEVFITGDFDNWQATHKMHKEPVSGYFVAVVPIDGTKQHQFKFVVDGHWCINLDLPTLRDQNGNDNNVIYAFGSGPLSPEYKEYAAIPAFNLTAAAY
ncbi:hypothetical protein G9A89_020979 [Geosiphon pyriformis]|nr:hypothetical protein G9A89_020979 [Geosiphon pyriformis]